MTSQLATDQHAWFLRQNRQPLKIPLLSFTYNTQKSATMANGHMCELTAPKCGSSPSSLKFLTVELPWWSSG